MCQAKRYHSALALRYAVISSAYKGTSQVNAAKIVNRLVCCGLGLFALLS